MLGRVSCCVHTLHFGVLRALGGLGQPACRWPLFDLITWLPCHRCAQGPSSGHPVVSQVCGASHDPGIPKAPCPYLNTASLHASQRPHRCFIQHPCEGHRPPSHLSQLSRGPLDPPLSLTLCNHPPPNLGFSTPHSFFPFKSLHLFSFSVVVSEFKPSFFSFLMFSMS